MGDTATGMPRGGVQGLADTLRVGRLFYRSDQLPQRRIIHDHRLRLQIMHLHQFAHKRIEQSDEPQHGFSGHPGFQLAPGLALHFGHPRYLAAHGAPKSIDALADHTLIGFDQESAYLRKVLKQFPWLSRSMLAFRTDSDLAQLAAIRAGFGIGICQVALAARDAALQRLLPRQCSLKMEIWIAMHEDLRASPRCAVTFAALAAGLSAYIRS